MKGYQLAREGTRDIYMWSVSVAGGIVCVCVGGGG